MKTFFITSVLTTVLLLLSYSNADSDTRNAKKYLVSQKDKNVSQYMGVWYPFKNEACEIAGVTEEQRNDDGIVFFLRQKEIRTAVSLPGDTVICKYLEKKGCTGYVIEGSRKSGKVIHVKPVNKKVPLEVE